MFEITTNKTFKAKHALLNYRGADERPHFHEWRCEVTISSDKLDISGCAVDFAEVDECFENVIRPIRKTFLNEIPMFTEVSTSAENVAKYIFGEMAACINSKGVRVSRVRVFEDPNHSASYFE